MPRRGTHAYYEDHPLRKVSPDYALDAALMRAQALAELIGYDVPYRCPVVWGKDSFDMFGPPTTGLID